MDVVRCLMPGLIAGTIAGALTAVTLIALNVGDLRVLLTEGSDGWLAATLLTFGLSSTFGSAAFATVLWSQTSDDED